MNIKLNNQLSYFNTNLNNLLSHINLIKLPHQSRVLITTEIITITKMMDRLSAGKIDDCTRAQLTASIYNLSEITDLPFLTELRQLSWYLTEEKIKQN